MPFTVSLPTSFGTITVTGDTPQQVLTQLGDLKDSDVALLYAKALTLGIDLAKNAKNAAPIETLKDSMYEESIQGPGEALAEAVLRETIVVDEPKPAKKPKKAAAEPKPPKMNGTKKVDAPVALPEADVMQMRAQAVVWMDDIYASADKTDNDEGIDRVLELLKGFNAKSSKDIPDDQFADFAASIESIHAEHVGS